MKPWCWTALALLAFSGGCAPGYYESTPPAYQMNTSDYQPAAGWYRNPESESRENQRIWSDEASR